MTPPAHTSGHLARVQARLMRARRILMPWSRASHRCLGRMRRERVGATPWMRPRLWKAPPGHTAPHHTAPHPPLWTSHHEVREEVRRAGAWVCATSPPSRACFVTAWGKAKQAPKRTGEGEEQENAPSVRAGKMLLGLLLHVGDRGYIIALSRIVHFHLEWDFSFLG